MVGRDGELDAEAVSFEELLERSDIVRRLPPAPAGPRQPCCSGGPACRESAARLAVREQMICTLL